MKTLTLGNVTLDLPLLAQHESDDDPYVEDVNNNRVCRINYLAGATWDDDVAIAHLFAASPDLLLAAEDLLSVLDIHEDLADSGETGALGHYTNDDAVYEAKTQLRCAIARARGKESK